MNSRIKNIISESIKVKQEIFDNQELLETIQKVSDVCIQALKHGNKILFCGNGGSASDAQHLAAELSGRFYLDSEPYFAEALHVNTSYITAVANDYSFEEVYRRMVRSKGRKGDILISLSTSGNSKNIILAMEEAQKIEMINIAMSGQTGGGMKKYADYLLNAPSMDTPRIQEAHILMGHIFCELIEKEMEA
ncbi:MAG: D-sedoheptulose 7-phosphate isomerase [Granulosicoccus sp.]|jgi:D-sedoheptulose 7-phosphate isomerase